MTFTGSVATGSKIMEACAKVSCGSIIFRFSQHLHVPNGIYDNSVFDQCTIKAVVNVLGHFCCRIYAM